MITCFLKVDVVLEDPIALGKELKIVTMDEFNSSGQRVCTLGICLLLLLVRAPKIKGLCNCYCIKQNLASMCSKIQEIII